MKTLSITVVDALTYTPSLNALYKTIDVLKDKINITTVYWCSDIKFPGYLGNDINVKWVRIERFKEYTNEYNFIALKRIPRIVNTDFNLTIHADGYAVNPDAWTDEFLEYDYIGAQWSFRFINKVGNGGFCLRSKKLYDAINKLKLPHRIEQFPKEIRNNTNITIEALQDPGKLVIPEDNIICLIYRQQLEHEYGIKFPPLYLADRFSIEFNTFSPWLGKSLGFHGKHGVAKYYGVEL